jgi:hypothetical protein
MSRLMEVDWSEADATVEEIGLPRLMKREGRLPMGAGLHSCGM